ncbi:MAG: DNA-protecting protein DprA [Rikenellaceae bacterium]
MANIYDIALTLTPRLGANGIAHLLECFSSAENIFSATEEELIHFAQLKPSVAKEIIKRSGLEAAKSEMAYCDKNGIIPVASTDKEYPQLLRETNDYPHVLYVKGNINILNNRAVSIVGTRKITPYGHRACDVIVKEIAECVPNSVLVSGLAFGVDSAVHRAALHYKVATIAVLPSPLNSITPAQHTSLANEIIESGGALVTELHSQISHNGRFYISRNRIIAGYSGATIIVESPESGGAMVTAKTAHGYNRIVGAVPGRITDFMSTGCNKLIANRVATAILSGADIIRELMWDLDEDVKPQASVAPLQLTPQEATMLKYFVNDEPLHINTLASVSGLPIGELSAMMIGLELSDAVKLLPGCRYERLIPLDLIP